MPEKLLKITYHGEPAGAAKKLNAYLRMPSKTLMVLRREIEMYLFQERQLPESQVRTYWIDTDGDEIEIVNQNDYEIFLDKCERNMHLQIAAAVIEKSESKQETAAAAGGPAEDDPTNFIIHDGVECDSCNAMPIVGFRYCCIQCPNYDLCQGCEKAHKHPEHLMVRMPTNNGPSVVDAWLSNPSAGSSHHRRSGRRGFRGKCPFSDLTVGAAAGSANASAQTMPTAPDQPRECRRDRKHSRRHGGGVLSQFVEMMMNLPESNTSAATPAAATAPTSAPAPESQAAKKNTEEPIVASAMTANKSEKPNDMPPKAPVVEAPVAPGAADAEEPVAAPRSPKEQPQVDIASAVDAATAAVESAAQAAKAAAAATAAATAAAATASAAASAPGSTPTTPVISLENLSQIVSPEYMRAGIEILNNFSEMFAKMIDPSEAAAFGCADTSMASNGSAASQKSEASATSTAQSTTSSASESPDKADKPQTVPVATENAQPEQRSRAESLDQEDWQMIDNNASPIANVSSSDALINLNTATTDASVSPVRDYVQLGEMLRQHVNEEQQREQTTAHTQTPQVDTVSTSTSTTAVATNSTSTTTTPAATPAAAAVEERRPVLVYHNDERVNASVHAMMAMGFSNEGAWLTQLLESVEGNIPAALDIMHTSQIGRN